MSLVTGGEIAGDAIARNSSALQFIARNRLKSNRVFSLLETQTLTRFVLDLVLLTPPAAIPTSPRIQNSIFCEYSGSSGLSVSSRGTSLGQNPSNSRLSSTAKP